MKSDALGSAAPRAAAESVDQGWHGGPPETVVKIILRLMITSAAVLTSLATVPTTEIVMFTYYAALAGITLSVVWHEGGPSAAGSASR